MTRRRWLPRGARPQLILLLLGALVAAQAGSILPLLDERWRAVRIASAKEAASRLLNVARELEATPVEIHPVVLRAAQSNEFLLSIDDRPLADATGTDKHDRLTRRVAEIVGAPPERALTIGLGDDDLAFADAAAGSYDAHDNHWGSDHMLLASAVLADGRWLNARFAAGDPPLQWAWPALALMALTAVGVVAAVWLSVGRIVGPLGALARAADRLGSSDKPAPLPLRGPTEVRQTTAAFNAMADRLTRLLDDRARMLAAVGHDLRSPITAMRIRLEMVDDEETRGRLARCLDEIHALVEAALALARGANVEEAAVAVDLRALLDEVAADLRERGAPVQVDAPQAVRAEVRPTAFKQAIRNIAENAWRYGGEARIALRQEGTSARIAIADDGPGIPAAEREQVFEPFVRLEQSRSRDTGGSGLGLAIARAAIAAHRGSIVLTDGDRGGTCAVVTIPLRQHADTAG